MYNIDPVIALGMLQACKPILKFICIRPMVDEATYRRLGLNFLRMHRRGRSGNERRYYYDYYMLCCGPIALTDRVEHPDQAVRAFGPDGALIENRFGTSNVRASVTEPSP